MGVMAAMDIPSDADESRPVIDDMAAYTRVFKPKRVINRNPSRPMITGEDDGSGGGERSKALSKVVPPQKLFSSLSSEGEDEENGPFCPPLATTRKFIELLLFLLLVFSFFRSHCSIDDPACCTSNYYFFILFTGLICFQFYYIILLVVNHLWPSLNCEPSHNLVKFIHKQPVHTHTRINMKTHLANRCEVLSSVFFFYSMCEFHGLLLLELAH